MDKLEQHLWNHNYIKWGYLFAIDVDAGAANKTKKVGGMEEITFTIENGLVIPHKNKKREMTAFILTAMLARVEFYYEDKKVDTTSPFINLFHFILDNLDNLWEKKLDNRIGLDLEFADIYIVDPKFPDEWHKTK